jgi:hypothetical protein
MQLDRAQRQMMKRSVLLAVSRERQRQTAMADELRAQIDQERAAMLAELTELKASIVGEYVEMRDELKRVRKEAALLREWHDATRCPRASSTRTACVLSAAHAGASLGSGIRSAYDVTPMRGEGTLRRQPRAATGRKRRRSAISPVPIWAWIMGHKPCKPPNYTWG